MPLPENDLRRRAITEALSRLFIHLPQSHMRLLFINTSHNGVIFSSY